MGAIVVDCDVRLGRAPINHHEQVGTVDIFSGEILLQRQLLGHRLRELPKGQPIERVIKRRTFEITANHENVRLSPRLFLTELRARVVRRSR